MSPEEDLRKVNDVLRVENAHLRRELEKTRAQLTAAHQDILKQAKRLREITSDLAR